MWYPEDLAFLAIGRGVTFVDVERIQNSGPDASIARAGARVPKNFAR